MGVGTGFCMYDVVVKKITFAISSPDEFLYIQLQFKIRLKKLRQRSRALLT